MLMGIIKMFFHRENNDKCLNAPFFSYRPSWNGVIAEMEQYLDR